MYPSDYGYSVLASSCARTTNLNSYGTAACVGQSWMYGQGTEWTLTPRSSSTGVVFFTDDVGSLSYDNPFRGISARPVLYLDPNVFIYDGDGSISDPYIIGM